MTVLKMKWFCRIIVFVLVFLNVEVLCKNARSDLPRCHLETGILKSQDSLKDIVKDAQYVFSGRVAGETFMNDDGSVHFKVQIKRVMKGDITGDVDLIRPGASNENCTLVVRNRQTLIFIAKSDANGGVILPVNPLRLNLATLDKINAAVKGVAYTPRPPIIEEPCERKFCAWNADCFPTKDFDTEPSGAYCKCPESCPADDESYVCGTDGITYTSRCDLRKISCNKHLELRVRHYGKCGVS